MTGTLKSIECPNCKAAFTLEGYLDHCRNYNRALGTCTFGCPRCQAKVDCKIEHATLVLGYIYGSGSPHFAGMLEFGFPHLRVAVYDTGISVECCGKQWNIV
jgi:hypothetical protein